MKNLIPRPQLYNLSHNKTPSSNLPFPPKIYNLSKKNNYHNMNQIINYKNNLGIFYTNAPLQTEFNEINNYNQNIINNNNFISNNNYYNYNSQRIFQYYNDIAIDTNYNYFNNNHYINSPISTLPRNYSYSNNLINDTMNGGNQNNIIQINKIKEDKPINNSNKKENINNNIIYSPLPFQFISQSKKNEIEKNGKKIKNIDINNDYQENKLNNSNQITNNSNKNHLKLKEKIFNSQYISPLNDTNMIKKEGKNNKINNLKQLNIPHNIKNNVKNLNKTLKNIKERPQGTLKPSNSVKNIELSSSKKDMENDFFDLNIFSKNNKKFNINKKNKSNSKIKSYKKFPNYTTKAYKENEKTNEKNEMNDEKEKEKEEDLIREYNKIEDDFTNLNNNLEILDNIIKDKEDYKTPEDNLKKIKYKCNLNIKKETNKDELNNENKIKFIEDNNNIYKNKNIENLEHNIETYQNIGNINSFDINSPIKTPKGNSGNKIMFYPKQFLKDSLLGKTKNFLEVKNFDRTKTNKNPKNNKRAKAKSNNINFKFINEIAKNNENINEIDNINKEINADNNINSLNNLSQTFKNKQNIINFSKKKKNDLNLITDRINHNKSPQKIFLNKLKDNNSNSKILNKSTSNENISPSDIENDDDNMSTIKNFNDKIKHKNKTLSTFENNKLDKIKKEIKNKNDDNIKFLKTENNIISTEINNMNKEKNSDGNNEIQKKIEYFKKYKCESVAGKDTYGKRKINQDVYLAKINMNNIEGFNAFGVLDGHGEYGHEISRFARDFIIEEINRNLQNLKVKTLPEIYSKLKKDDFSLIKKAFKNVDKQLPKQEFNGNFSGSTCVIVFQIGENLITANVGDSRAILIYSDNPKDKTLKNTKIIELSIDQKPDLPLEKARIYKMGGIVDQMLDGKGKRNGPFRVWAGRQNYPGLAMSRCLGDLKGKKYGLISEPEIIEYKLNNKTKYMVICSDGVWEFLKNEDVMNIGNNFYINNNIDDFIKEIMKTSHFLWKKEDIVRDDITVVVVFF